MGQLPKFGAMLASRTTQRDVELASRMGQRDAKFYPERTRTVEVWMARFILSGVEGQGSASKNGGAGFKSRHKDAARSAFQCADPIAASSPRPLAPPPLTQEGSAQGRESLV